MNEIIIAAIIGVVTLIPVIVIWRMARTTARTVYALESQIENLRQLEAKVAAQNQTIAEQWNAIDRLRVEASAQRAIIKLQGDGIEKLQAEVATWKRKFNAVIAWARTIAPGKDVDALLAQLEAGPRGG